MPQNTNQSARQNVPDQMRGNGSKNVGIKPNFPGMKYVNGQWVRG